jgi:hypothetical protein
MQRQSITDTLTDRFTRYNLNWAYCPQLNALPKRAQLSQLLLLLYKIQKITNVDSGQMKSAYKERTYKFLDPAQLTLM